MTQRRITRDHEGKWGPPFNAALYQTREEKGAEDGYVGTDEDGHAVASQLGADPAADTVLYREAAGTRIWQDRRLVGVDWYVEGEEQVRPQQVNLTGNGISAEYDGGSGQLQISINPTVSGIVPRPKGHLLTDLPHARSHWRCLDSILGGTALPDELGNHAGTGAAAFDACGRPAGYWSEGQVWLTQNSVVTLGNTASLLTALRDTSCAFMCWLQVGSITTTRVLFQFAGAGETLATNAIFQVFFDTNARLTTLWEHSAGTDVTAQSTHSIAPGMRHVCVFREHAATSTAHFLIDGDLVKSTSGLTNPGGGTTATGTLSNGGSYALMTDAALLSGSGLTLANVQAACRASWLRGMGVY